MECVNVLFLKPFLSNKIWGGNKLSNFGYELTSNNVGEALVISALNNMSSIITNPELNNMTLKDFYDSNREFFANYEGDYPLLTKIIDANDKLSVQVHPDNEYAKFKHNGFGKTECWYILEAEPGAKLVYGLKSKNLQDSVNLINESKWDELLNYVDVKKGDFIFVPSGMVHAIGKGILIYELQQSSDITYRFYDYDRLENNKPRELHLEDALKVTRFDYDTSHFDSLPFNCEYFSLTKKVINGTETIKCNNFWYECTVIEGSGKIQDREIKKGDAFIIGNNRQVEISGNITLLIGSVTK